LLSFDGPSPETFTAGTFFAMCGQFLLIGLGSFVMGVVLAALNAFILRRTTLRDHPPTEIFFVLGWAYVSYVLSDAIGLSGTMGLWCTSNQLGPNQALTLKAPPPFPHSAQESSQSFSMGWCLATTRITTSVKPLETDLSGYLQPSKKWPK
jgi:NhaP-type Na+/H+ or K+/H+ antiporter